VERVGKTSPECITFVGDGEPTLSADLGWYIEQCKARWSTPVATITNGSLLFREEVRRSLVKADIVLPSLDAGDERTFREINRPHPDLDFHLIVEGLIAFRRMFQGQMRLEIMLVKGLNDSDSNLRNLRKLVWAIRPDYVDIAIPTRPPAETWVMSPDPESVLCAQRYMHSAGSMVLPETGAFEFAGFSTVLDSVIALSSRHPLRWEQAQQVETAFGQPGELKRLVDAGRLATAEYQHTRFVRPPEESGQRKQVD